jgi:hypothetical protein
MLCMVDHKKATYRDLPVVGEGIEAFPKIKTTLLLNWEGHAYKIGPLPDRLQLKTFEAADKGIPAVYGVDKDGNVICSIALYDGDESSENPDEKGKHFNISKAKHTGGYQ